MSNGSTLIISIPGDVHAAAVEWGLRVMKNDVTWWRLSEYMGPQKVALTIEPNGNTYLSSSGPQWTYSQNTPDVVWLRRKGAAMANPQIAAVDQEIAKRETNRFLASVVNFISPDAQWVNSLNGSLRGNDKLLQLAEATRVGLIIPDTIISNDPDEIRKFSVKHGGNVIHKMFHQAAWTRQDGKNTLAVHAFTAPVPSDVLQNDAALLLVPGIYQERIARVEELRLTIMGRTCIAVALDLPKAYGDKPDWRAVQHTMTVREIELPFHVKQLCFDLMERLGLAFGCVDLIKDTHGRYVFLEVNEMGNFLWVEQMDRSVRVLEAFCAFLASGGKRDFVWDGSKWPELTMEEFRASKDHATLKSVDYSPYVNANYKVAYPEN